MASMLNGTDEKVVSGLRRTVRKDNSKTSDAVRLKGGIVCASPFERLCELIAGWDFIPDAIQATSTKTKDMPIRHFDQIPIVFSSFANYVNTWEPLLFEEIKANILSNFSSKVRNSINSKPFQFSLAENKDRSGNLQILETQFSTFTERSTDFAPSKMDVVLISAKVISSPDFNCKTSSKNDSNATTTKTSNVSKFSELASSISTPTQAQVSASTVGSIDSAPSMLDGYLLGVVFDQRVEAGVKIYQIKVMTSGWENMRQKIKEMNAASNSTVSNTASTSGSLGGSVGNSTVKTTSIQGQQSTTQSTRIVNKNGRLSTYSMHYVVVENIRSSWREFQAIHDLGSNVPLLGEVLVHSAASRVIDMCHTPPGVQNENDSRPQQDNKQQGNSNNSVSSEMTVTSSSSSSSTQRVSIQTEIMTWCMNGVTDKFMSYLRHKYNPSQLHAIRTAATQMGFTLVQGPPGTGKTSTIIGMMNSIHIREYNRYYELALKTVLGPQGVVCRESNSQKAWLDMVASLARHKPHILVVAPSNVAVDNIIERIMIDEFLDGNGGKYSPHMLRVGGGKTPRVQSVSLEDTIKSEESVLYMRTGERQAKLEQLNLYITQLIKDIYFLQTMLFNMKIAFDAHYPLPEGFELCVCDKTARPIWKNHIKKEESFTPPVIVKREVPPLPGIPSSGKVRFSRIEKLPQFGSCAHHLTQLLDQLGNTNLKRSWLQAVMVNSANNRGNSVSNKELLENSIIDTAQLVFTTLNSSGHPCMESTEFCVTVIDEAAQCVEPSVLIALRRGCKQCIMVGDQKQLSATTFSTSAKAAGFDRSLFERLVDSGHPYIMLDTQYRMTPSICTFASNEFYSGALRSGSNVCLRDYVPPYIADVQAETGVDASADVLARTPLFTSFMFFDLYTSSENDANNTASQSKFNLDEVSLCVNIVRALSEEASRSGVTLGSVAVITPYSDQLIELRRAMIRANLMSPPSSISSNKDSSSKLQSEQDSVKSTSSVGSNGQQNETSSHAYLDIECNTVDGFQGREKDLVILSTVRANDLGSIGFVSDPRRLNVALTRAKYGVFVVGHAQTLSCNEHWCQLMEYAQSVEGFVRVGNAETNVRDLLIERQNYNKYTQDDDDDDFNRQQSDGSNTENLLGNYDEEDNVQQSKKRRTDNPLSQLQPDNMMNANNVTKSRENAVTVYSLEEGEIPDE